MATQPCPCGNAGDSVRLCRCAAGEIERYRARLSGPLADRIDLHVHVGAVPVGTLAMRDRRGSERSATIRDRVTAARALQRTRYAAMPRVFCNAHVPARALDTPEGIEPPARDLLSAAAERIGLTARGYHRVLRVARTIADLDSAAGIASSHIAEALRYRPADHGLCPVQAVTRTTTGAGALRPDQLG